MTATLRQVAERAGVSPTTASLVARGVEGRVSEEVRLKVLAAIRDLGYAPNESARRLRRRRSSEAERWPKTGRIGIIVYGGYMKHKHPYFARLLDSLEVVARERGLDVGWAEGEEALRDGALLARRLNPEAVDGVVSVAVSVGTVLDGLKGFARPVVSVSAGAEGGVGADLASGGALAAEHLLELGHERMAFIYPEGGGGSSSCERLDGAMMALQKAGVAVPPEWVVTEDRLGFEVGLKRAGELLDASERPTAIAAGNDLTGLGVLRAAAERGLRVPEDLSVVGFNGDDVSEYCTPPLTTVVLDTGAIAAAALDRMETLFRRPGGPQSVTLVSVSLAVRKSTGPPCG